ncbi:MAG: xanthine dehydrogenase family protein subunit M [Anaerolineae bacterium]|nr:xanthine dehydrogenase family protein subunit M [Anaerolineae bacterium]
MINPHPGLPELEYVMPASLDEASKFLIEHTGEAKPFMGGTDCFVRLRDGAWNLKYLVNVKGLDGTNEIRFDPKNGLTIGAAVPMNKIVSHPDINKHYPLLTEAARTVASYQLRSRATIGGNICNASPAGDTIGACIVYGGKLNVHSIKGKRLEPLASFFKGPGKTVLEPGDIVTSISFPLPPPNHVGRYIKLGRNKISDLAIVGVTVLGYPDSNAKSGYTFKIALASVAPVPLVPLKAEQILADKPLNENIISEAAQAAMDSCTPIDDVRSSARYRKYMIRNLTRQALTDVWQKIKK